MTSTLSTGTAVVVPTWNGCHLLEECLDSLLAQTLPARLIVVDNGSVDGTAELVRSHYPKVELIALDRNYGFAGAVNRGLHEAIGGGAEFVALLNNDAAAEPEWLEHLVAAMQRHSDTGIVTAKVLQPDGRFDSAGNLYSVWGHPFPRGRDEVDTGQYDEPEPVFGASGGASLYRVAMLDEVGTFDEDFFAYYEDDDLSFRAQLAGWKVRYEPSSQARHRIAATSSRHPTLRRYHVIRNTFSLFHKNMPWKLYLRYLPRFSVGFMSLLTSVARRGDVGALFPALGRVVVSLPALVRKRRSVQSSRVVPDSYVDSILCRDVPPNHRFPFVRPVR